MSRWSVEYRERLLVWVVLPRWQVERPWRTAMAGPGGVPADSEVWWRQPTDS
jgi:hypothetical protein